MNKDTSWEGNERRTSGITLSDILLELREMRKDVNHMLKEFVEHKQDDDKRFKEASDEIREIRKDTVWLQRIAFGLFGAYFIIQLFIQSGALRVNSYFSSTDSRSNISSSSSSSNVGSH